MGINHWWAHGLGLLLSKSEYRDLDEFSGKKIAIDLSIWMNQLLSSDIDKLASTSEPVERSPDLLRNIQTRHETFVSQGITPVYVYDGFAPEVKNKTRAKRKELRDKDGKAWTSLLERGLNNVAQEFTEQELVDAAKSRMKMRKPTYLDQAAILKWMKSEDIHVIGSLFEADQQMVKLEQEGMVDGILSEDGDIVALGGKLVLAKLSRKSNGNFQVKVFDRAEFMQSDNPYNSKLCKYPGIETHCALLLGNDYHHISGNGEVTVLGTKEKSYAATGARKENGMLDKLDGADDKLEWVRKFGQKGTKELSPEVFNQYKDSYHYMLHSPTLGLDGNGNVTIKPLNELPVQHLSWTALLGNDLGLGELLHDTNALSAIYNCDVLPMTRKPLGVYDDELSRPCLFQSLDFTAHPINVQPKLCIVNWLRARGIDARVSDSRCELENFVRSSLDKGKQVQANVLKPIVGVHDGFHKIKMRLADNELDTPSQKYVTVMKKLELISDDVIDRELGERQGKPCIRRRVEKLIKSGNFHASSIRCRNVQCKETSIPCILFTIEC